MQVMQTSAVFYLSGDRLVWIKAIFYLDEAEYFIASSSVKLYFQTRQDIPFAPAAAW